MFLLVVYTLMVCTSLCCCKVSVSLSPEPEKWTNIPLLVKVFKLIVNELSSVVEANAIRAAAADWSPGDAL